MAGVMTEILLLTSDSSDDIFEIYFVLKGKKKKFGWVFFLIMVTQLLG